MNTPSDEISGSGRVVALSGGIGGAKLALGLRNVLAPGRLHVIANTGDDFEHLGLHVSPDIDTLLYTLGGLNDVKRGWGRKSETWTFMEALAQIGGETWFQLGDGDLATHVERTRRLHTGQTLTEITAHFAERFCTAAPILPMCDEPVRTLVHTDEGVLEFQDYFVARQCRPAVKRIDFVGAKDAVLSTSLQAVLAEQVDAIIICPSNPLISIEPILAVPGMRAALRRCGAPIVAVSPIIGGEAVKGPTAKMFRELGLSSTNEAVARRYEDFADVIIIDEVDHGDRSSISMDVLIDRTMMTTIEDRERLARAAMQAALSKQ